MMKEVSIGKRTMVSWGHGCMHTYCEHDFGRAVPLCHDNCLYTTHLGICGYQSGGRREGGVDRSGQNSIVSAMYGDLDMHAAATASTLVSVKFGQHFAPRLKRICGQLSGQMTLSGLGPRHFGRCSGCAQSYSTILFLLERALRETYTQSKVESRQEVSYIENEREQN